MQNNDQKGSLKDTFSDFGAAPTDGLWNAISEQLDEKKKRRFAVWWWSTGLAAVLVVGFMFWNWKQDAETKQPVGGRSYAVHYENVPGENSFSKGGTLATAADSIQTDLPSRFNKESFIFNWESIELSLPYYHFNMSDYNPFPNFYFPVELPYVAAIVLPDSVKVADLLTNTDSTLTTLPDSTMTASIDDTIIRPMETQLLLKYVPKNWQIGLFAGRSQAITQSYPLIKGTGSSPPPSMAINPAVETRYSWDADLTVSRRLRRNWWLGSGAHFGWLESGKITETSTYKSGKVSYVALGVPISIGRELWIGGRFNITPMVGFRYDYAFRKTEEYTFQSDFSSISSADSAPVYTKTTGKAHLHFVSGFAGAEIAFSLLRNWKLVAKPTMQFYVYGKTDETTPNTFRKAWFSGAIGVTKRF